MAKSRQGQAAGSSIPSRLPATRERRPALAALALLLIVGGALGSGWLALRAGDRADFLQVKEGVALGQQIGEDDLTTVNISDDFKSGIPAGELDQVVGQYARTPLVEDQVLSRSMISGKNGIATGTTQLPIPVGSGDVINGLQSGANVAIYLTFDETSQQLAIQGQVIRINTPNDGSGGIGSGDDQTTVQVAVDDSCGSLIARAKSEDKVVLGLVGDVEAQSDLESTCSGS